MSLRSVGFYGAVHLQLRNHHVLDAKSEASTFDLRINRPFDELKVILFNCMSYCLMSYRRTRISLTSPRSLISIIIILLS